MWLGGQASDLNMKAYPKQESMDTVNVEVALGSTF